MFKWLKKRRIRAEMRRLAHKVLQEEALQQTLVVDRWLALEEHDAKAYDHLSSLIVQSCSLKLDFLNRRRQLAAQLERL